MQRTIRRAVRTGDVSRTALALSVVLLLGSSSWEVTAEDLPTALRNRFAELDLETGTERLGSASNRLPTEIGGQSLVAMRKIGHVQGGVYVITSPKGLRQCELGIGSFCPEPGSHWVYVEKKHSASERIAQGRKMLGSGGRETKKYSMLRYNQTLYVYETATSRVLWERNWKSGEALFLATDNERIYVATDQGLSAIEIRTAKERWSESAVHGAFVARIGQLDGKLLVQVGRDLLALNSATGQLLWTYVASGSVTPWLHVAKGIVYVVARAALPTGFGCTLGED